MKTINVFEYLFNSELCFIVCVSEICFNDYSIKDYTLGIKATRILTAKMLKDIGFEKNHDSNLYEYEMKQSDKTLFFEHKDEFVKVLHNKFGRIYELKGNSFKKFYRI